jgi:GNAT superfamily N-acetyltransferase
VSHFNRFIHRGVLVIWVRRQVLNLQRQRFRPKPISPSVDFIRQVALLADLHGEIIGGARYYIWSPGQADIAFIVGDAYQNKGIASAMLRHLAFIARDAGITDLHAHTLPDNRRALRVLDKLGFPCTVARKRNMMHVTVHLDSTAHPDGSQAA